MNYEALIGISVLAWRIVATIRQPVLKPLQARLVAAFLQRGEWLYSAVVWAIAFVIGYTLAYAGGQANGDMLHALEWTSEYPEFGYAMTAGVIASGSAGLRLAEKWFAAKGL